MTQHNFTNLDYIINTARRRRDAAAAEVRDAQEAATARLRELRALLHFEKLLEQSQRVVNARSDSDLLQKEIYILNTILADYSAVLQDS